MTRGDTAHANCRRDDDASARKALARLLTASSFEIETYGSARDFLKSLKVSTPDRLAVDLHMPELTGFDLQRHMARATVVAVAQGLGVYAACVSPLDHALICRIRPMRRIGAARDYENSPHAVQPLYVSMFRCFRLPMTLITNEIPIMNYKS